MKIGAHYRIEGPLARKDIMWIKCTSKLGRNLYEVKLKYEDEGYGLATCDKNGRSPDSHSVFKLIQPSKAKRLGHQLYGVISKIAELRKKEDKLCAKLEKLTGVNQYSDDFYRVINRVGQK